MIVFAAKHNMFPIGYRVQMCVLCVLQDPAAVGYVFGTQGSAAAAGGPEFLRLYLFHKFPTYQIV
jgi:hypothetical protein